jgi:hypothetical protein
VHDPSALHCTTATSSSFARSIALHDAMLSATIAFPNKKNMDAFIVCFVHAKASVTPLSEPAVGGLFAAPVRSSISSSGRSSSLRATSAEAAATPSGGGASSASEKGVLAHVLMAGGVLMSFMMKRGSKVGDVFVSALGATFHATDKRCFELVALNSDVDAGGLVLEQSLEEYCVRNPLPKTSAPDGSFRTCIVELLQVWFMPLSLSTIHPPLLLSCVYQAHFDFIMT